MLTRKSPLFVIVVLALTASLNAASRKEGVDPYAKYVWPPPPDAPRIRLAAILKGRADVETASRFGRLLLGAGPQNAYDWLKRPFGVAYDLHGRLLVSDAGLGALFRFDRELRKLDILGTTGALRLKNPLGITVASDGTIFVADIGLKRVVSFDSEGNVRSAYGRTGELVNPTAVAVSPDGSKVYVADSKGQKIVIFDRNTSAIVSTFGSRGAGDGEFAFPTSLAFSGSGELCVVDQVNARVQVFSPTGEYITQFGGRGVGFGNFVRPKGIAFDKDGLLYVTDAAFSNVQIFSSELRLLTFVGDPGSQPGQFQNTGAVATYKNEFAVVDQLNSRVEIFRFIGAKTTD
jgi:DNA-binding beta-propeller fold protein YncE